MFKRILCATDGSEHGDRALRQAVRIALGSDGELHVAHVVEKMPGGGRMRGQNVHLTEFEIDSRIVRQAAACNARSVSGSERPRMVNSASSHQRFWFGPLQTVP